MRGTILVIVFFVNVFLVGCGEEQAAQNEETTVVEKTVVETVEVTQEETVEEASVPPYTATAEQDCPPEVGHDATCVSLSSDATSAEDIEAITQDLREQNPDTNLVVSVYPNEPTADMSGMGYAFADEEAAQAVLDATYPEEATLKPKVSEVMANDGVYVISIADEVDTMVQEECENWTEEDTELLGPPPEEWNCEQFQ